MRDDAAPSAELRQPRAVGEIAVTAHLRDGGSHLKRLRQAGCAKALTPRHPEDDLLAVTINTAGGLTGGDRLDISGEAAAGARLTMTTQAAERAYRAQPNEIAAVNVRLTAATGGRIDWLPQETILFDDCALQRRIEVDQTVDNVRAAVVSAYSQLQASIGMGVLFWSP